MVPEDKQIITPTMIQAEKDPVKQQELLDLWAEQLEEAEEKYGISVSSKSLEELKRINPKSRMNRE